MNHEPAELAALIRLARAGDQSALGQLLERFRVHLGHLAERRLAGRITSRLGASDVVQQTFLEAHRDFPQFAGEAEGELIVWLARILDRNAADALHNHLHVQKRAMTHEARLPDEGQSSGHCQAGPAIAGESSPSQQAIHNEQQEWLEQALEHLPSDQQRAVRLRYFESQSLAEIAEQMGRSLSATAGLLKRGLQGLNKQRRQ